MNFLKYSPLIFLTCDFLSSASIVQSLSRKRSRSGIDRRNYSRIEFDSFQVERLEVAEIVGRSTSDPTPVINYAKFSSSLALPSMDNSAYVPNHLPPPSLVVFSQAGGLPEALRMQRPFNPQVTDSKDLQVPFSTAASLGYGLHHMLHLPPQFLHPLDHRLPFGGFRPLVPSAFAPPSKCLKVETGNGAVPGRSPTGTGGTGSVPNRGATPDEEDRDANATPGSENTERSTPEEGRPYRREFNYMHVFCFFSERIMINMMWNRSHV
ncbi:hypothetical protein ALC60_12002 [Trachymyrmex zeteki]|uniref:Uncharacterized protein n=1 Tax=Mycetomoellerius zeteki TaxID=64791 RepID=A0A151WMB3_9HYME|nr:hypothetical protein ALC60_12002 [Trachymyrmex zeteki]